MDERYQIVSVLGTGTHGTVHEAYDVSADTTVARKTLRVSSPRSSIELKREFRALADTSHPNLVQLFELETAGDEISFTMELVRGSEITQYAQERRGEIRELLAQLLAGCQAIHGRGLVHRDLKPSNVLVEHGRVVILDFGLISVLEAPASGRFSGTPAYAAPEQLIGEQVGASADIFSAGVIAYEMVFGVPPNWRPGWRLTPPPAITDVEPSIVEMITGMLRLDPDERPTIEELLAQLNEPDLSAATIPNFIGRQTELEHALAPASDVVVVRGESGIGKSRFLHELLTHYRNDGKCVLFSECRLWENIAFQAFDPIVDALLRTLPDDASSTLTDLEKATLSDAFYAIDYARKGAHADTDTSMRRDALLSGLAKLLAIVEESVPLVLAIDDFQWVDRDSFGILRDLMRRGALANALIVITSRREENEALEEWLENVPVYESIELAPFTRKDAISFLQLNFARASLDEAAVYESSGGSPFLLSEIARARRVTNATGQHLSYSQVVGDKLSTLDSETADLVSLICISDSPMETTVLESLVVNKGSHYTLLALQKDAWIRSLVGPAGVEYEPYHSKLRECVLDGTAPHHRSLHLRIANALEQLRPTRFDRRAHHLHGAGHDGEAAGFAVKAGIESQNRLAFDSARKQFERALDWGSFEEDSRSEVELRLAQALRNLGECSRSAAVAEGAPSGQYLSAREHALLAADGWFSAGELERGLLRLGDVLGEKALTSPNRVRLWTSLILYLLQFRLTALRPSSARSAGDPWLADAYLSLGKLNMMSSTHGAWFQLRALTESLKTGDERRIARGLAFLANMYEHLGLFPTFSRACMARAQQIGEKHDDAIVLGTCLVWQSQMSVIRERWPEAIGLARQGIRLMEERHYGMTWECTTAHNFELMSLEKLGEIDDVLSMAEELVESARARHDQYTMTMFGLFDCFWGIPSRSPELTRQNIATASAIWVGDRFTIQHLFMLRAEIYSFLYEGKAERAWDRLAEAWPEVSSSDVPSLPNSDLDSRVLRVTAALHLANAHGLDRPIRKIVKREIRKLHSNSLAEATGYAHYFDALLSLQTHASSEAMQDARKAMQLFTQIGSRIPQRYAAELLKILGETPIEGGSKNDFAARLPKAWLHMMVPVPNDLRKTSTPVPG